MQGGQDEVDMNIKSKSEQEDNRSTKVHIPIQPRPHVWQDKAVEPKLSKSQKKAVASKAKREAIKNENDEKRRLAKLAAQLAQQPQADKLNLKDEDVVNLLASPVRTFYPSYYYYYLT